MKLIAGIAVGLVLGVGGTLLAPQEGMRLATAQGSPVGNGDCNGDGRIDLTDVVWLLKFVFVPGSEAPARVGDPECEARVAELEEQLASSEAARLAAEDGLGACQDDLSLCQANVSGLVSLLVDCQAERDAVEESLATCQTKLADCEAQLEESHATLLACQAELDACREALASHRLPATGQTLCYDFDGAVIDCASEDYPGQDGFYRAGCPTEGRFVDNGDGTVSDLCTNHMWQKETSGTYSWQNALLYCENLELGGHTDWRLPNVRELLGIVDYERWDPAIDPLFDTVSFWYWSSSTCVGSPVDAWVVLFGGSGQFGDGGLGRDLKTDDLVYVRAVRGAISHP